VGSVSLVVDLFITYDRFGSSSDLSINGHLHYPNDVEMSLNETVSDKYHTDCDNNSSNAISFMSVIASTSDRLHSDFVCLLFLQAHRETDLFFAVSGVLSQYDRRQFHNLRSVFSSQLKSKWNKNWTMKTDKHGFGASDRTGSQSMKRITSFVF
jgi:hypothetical protein